MTSRRVVRVTADLLEALDAQLPDERDHRPSRNDFAHFDLLDIVEVFATRWDDLPTMYQGPGTYRVLIHTGRMAPMVSVVGRIAGDAPSS